MAEAVDYWLDGLDGCAMRDRRNGTYPRHLLSELGDIELRVPRTRHFCPTEVLKSYARRAPEIDRVILAGFVLGLSTRKVSEVLLPLLGRPISAATVSRVAKTLDAAVAAFHGRPLANRLQGARARRRGAGAQGRGLIADLPIVYPTISLQRCWAHKIRNILNKVRKPDRDASRTTSTPS